MFFNVKLKLGKIANKNMLLNNALQIIKQIGFCNVDEEEKTINELFLGEWRNRR